MDNIIGNWREPPTIEQWVARDKIMHEINSDASNSAHKYANNGNSYFYSSEGLYHSALLVRELESCFRCGNWLSTICISAATIETFLSDFFQKNVSSANKNKRLQELEFPEIELYKEIIDARNSIMHLRDKSFKKSFHNISDEELFILAKKSLWLSYFLVDYVLYKQKS